MLSISLKSEINWFLSGLLGALLASLAIGWPAVGVCCYLLGYIAWLLWRMETMVRWLSSGAHSSTAPDSNGLTDEMVQLIHREKKYSLKQKNRYRSALAQFNSLAADLPDATIVLTKDFEIQWANSAALHILNIHPDRDRGQRIDNLVRAPEFREFLYAKSAEDELEMRSPSSSDRVLSLRKVPTGKHMMVLLAADITQRVQVREMRKAFVGDVSHELRTPLTVIRGYIEMLREDEQLPGEIASGLNHIARQSDRMQGIVEDLLQLSRLEGNTLVENEGDTINISTMVQSMIGPLKVTAEHHTFVTKLDDSLALLGLESEIYSACHNLLTNAVRYTQAGSTIEVSWQLEADGCSVYRVKDNGAGIEARHISRLSERFYRVDSGRSREAGGTGLGLAIVKHAVQRHGGGLSIKSTPGSGSEFSIKFPSIRTIQLRKTVNG